MANGLGKESHMFCGDLWTMAQKLAYMGVLPCLLLLSVVSGCAQAPPPPEPVTITFAPALSDADYEAVIQAFHEDYPHITVELTGPDDEEVDTFMAPSFDLSELLEQGDVLSVNPFSERDTSFDLTDFYAGTVELFAREGETWAIPAEVDAMVTFYNRDAFDEYGVRYPEVGWTQDDFLDMALALSDPDAGVFGYVPIDVSLDSLAFIYLHGGRIFDDWQNPTRTTFDDPLTIEALEWYVRLTEEYNVAPTQAQLYREPFAGNAQSGVYRNKVGMWIGWLHDMGGSGDVNALWPVEWKMRWGVVPLPHDSQAATLTFALGYFISSQAQDPDACWQWISFLSQQNMLTRLIPARKSVAESAEYEQLVGSEVAAAARASMENAVLIPELGDVQAGLQIFGRAIDAIMDGRATPREALTQAQQQAER
jgi:multiple sugar transport system substrate-binding protein